MGLLLRPLQIGALTADIALTKSQIQKEETKMKHVIAAAAVACAGLLPAAAQACPDFSQPGMNSLGSLAGSYLYSPRYYSVIAGGSVDLGSCPQPGIGNVISAPDFEFSFDNDSDYGRLEISVTADCDTVLLIHYGKGQWAFNDDTNGLSPQVDISNPPSGEYNVWVGTFGDATCSAEMELETWHN